MILGCFFSLVFPSRKRHRSLAVTGVQTCVLSFSSRRRHTRLVSDWSSDVCSSDLVPLHPPRGRTCGGSFLGGTSSPPSPSRWAAEGATRNRPACHWKGCTETRTRPAAEIGRASCRERG